MKGNETIAEIGISAMLHDIGKFAQRAGQRQYYDDSMAGQILKLNTNGYYTHQHALYTFGFIDAHKHIFPDNIDINSIRNIAAEHHNPTNNPASLIISMADQTASGLDRNAVQDESVDDRKFYEIPLKSIFSKISFSDSRENEMSLPLRKIDDNYMEYISAVSLKQDEYAALWKGFEEDCKKINNPDIHNYFYILDSLLERWTTAIPSATYKTEPDVSLYDHSRITAALAVAAYLYHRDTDTLNEKEILDLNTKKWLLVRGDVQGIQSYIFDLKAHTKASKLLRAKSFQVEALAKSVAEQIIDECECIYQCEIMNAGGGFWLLLPNTEKVRKILKKTRAEIETRLLNEYIGQLGLAISDGVAVSANDLNLKNDQGSQDLFSKSFNDLRIAKLKKFSEGLKQNGHVLSQYYDEVIHKKSQGINVCTLCDYRPGQFSENQEETYCDVCDASLRFSALLPKAEYLSFSKNQNKNDAQAKAFFGFRISKAEGVNDSSTLVYSINKYKEDVFLPVYRLPYHVPTDANGDVLTFEDLAFLRSTDRNLESEIGTHKIAMFKADVDNLGKIFSDGLGKQKSISRVATLSRNLHHFFSVILNEFIKNKFPMIYTVYSGGDDICVIGHWYDIILFALQIQNEFKKYICNNPDITLSAGIAMANPNVPIRFIAEMAEEQLEMSKHYKKNSKLVKNAITIFNTTVSWEEFRWLIDDSLDFAKRIKSQKVSAGFVYSLIGYSERARKIRYSLEYNELEKAPKPLISTRDLLWKSHLHYSIARLKDRYKSCNEPEFFENLIKKYCDDIGDAIINAKISASVALYLTRTHKEKEEQS